jgi:DNA-binding XRE family transcriptional regulator
MFPNLEAEQARRNHTNDFVAKKLGISRQSYESKKKNGGFKLKEITKLLSMYNSAFDYLFSQEAYAEESEPAAPLAKAL